MKKVFTTLAVITLIFISCKKDKDKKADPTAPLVTTAALTNVAGGNATAGGSIVSDGGSTITKAGVVWSKTNAIPTIADSLVAATATSGAFTVNLNNIDFGNTYYFRAFATNTTGTGYGDVVTLTTSNDSVRFTYNGQSVTYGIIVSPTTGKKWLDRNLGAQRVATDYNDYQAYGDLFQWGRPADGHQLIAWTAANASDDGNSPNVGINAVNGTTTVLATSDIPGHNNYIIPPYALPLDWRDVNTGNRWSTNPQGPCPAGWHVPTLDEWQAEVSTAAGGTASSGGMTDRSSGYNQLKLTVAGNRLIDGPGSVNFYQVARAGHYWSSSEEIDSRGFNKGIDFNPGPSYMQTGGSFKCAALSVRCIKDN